MLGRQSFTRRRAGTVIAATALVTTGLAVLPAEADIPDSTEFHVGQHSHTEEARKQAAQAQAAGDHESAKALRKLSTTPQAQWVTSGTPDEVRRQVQSTTEDAARAGRMPVLVAYNLPLLDCSGYSAGGASGAAEYRAWIDAVAAGIGDRDAVVVLEPDSLGLIPWYTDGEGRLDSCRPAGADPATAAAERLELLNHAVTALKAKPGTRVYLDGTHSAWQGVGEIADRLVRAGVQRADGFSLNVSNYELTEKQLKYGTWVSKCIHYATAIDPGNYSGCASQYHPADVNDFSTWGRTDDWYARHVDTAEKGPSGPEDLAHFVVDTSRNGKGPWTPQRSYPDPQTWCNPPGRGLGPVPTTDTGNPLADAFLWIKIPGESDGSCDRGLGAGTADPEWGLVPPPPGGWFPEQAVDLIRNADPSFLS